MVGLWHVSIKNIEMGVLWEHIYKTDQPVSLLFDKFYNLYLKFFPQSSYPTPEALFHLIFGGILFFFWGWIVGVFINKILKNSKHNEKVK